MLQKYKYSEDKSRTFSLFHGINSKREGWQVAVLPVLSSLGVGEMFDRGGGDGPSILTLNSAFEKADRLQKSLMY